MWTLAADSLLYIFQLLPLVDLTGQDSQSEWAHSAASHPPGPARLHSPDWHFSTAVSCLSGAGSQPEAGGRCAGHDLAAPPHHCCPCTLLQGQHLLHHLPAGRSACSAVVVTCQAVPSHVVPSCAALRYAVLCCPVLYCAVPCCAPPCCAVAYYAVMCCVKPCCTWLLLCSADKILYAPLDCCYLGLRHAMQCFLRLFVDVAD